MKTPKEATSRKALGRGLAALIPPSPPSEAGSDTGLRLLPVERVKPSKAQPRKNFQPESLDELAASIKEQGVLQPIVVRRSDGGYEVVAGERRWRAACRAGLHEIPAVVKEYSDQAALQVALIENLQREDLDPLEEASAYHRLLGDYKLSHEQVASAVGKSRSAVTNSLRLLKLPEKVLTQLASGGLTAGHARALMTLADEKALTKLANEIVQRGLSVREAEHSARQIKRAPKNKASASKPTPAERDVEESLQKALGTRVRLRQRAGKGRIEIHFHSLDHLDALLAQLTA